MKLFLSLAFFTFSVFSCPIPESTHNDTNTKTDSTSFSFDIPSASAGNWYTETKNN